MSIYIQRKDPFGLETVDEFDKLSEAMEAIREYRQRSLSAKLQSQG